MHGPLRNILFIALLGWHVLPVRPQYLSNGSFEGRPAMHQPPPGWYPCKSNSTPDTQPGIWGHTMSASDGGTYLSMVTRGPWGANANSTEDCQTELLEELSPDECYELTIDLATCEDCGHTSDIGWISYARPVILNIYASTALCQKDMLIASFGPVTNFDWQTFRTTFSPSGSGYRYVLLEAGFAEMPEYFGTIVVDNLRLRKTTIRKTVLTQALYPGDTIRLQAGPGTSYRWEPEGLLSCTHCQAPTATFEGNLIYSVLIRDSSIICPWREEFQLWEASSLFVPNAFTPDGDGLNDHFTPVFSGNLIRMDLSIFDRAGMRIWQSTRRDEGWDGRVRGSPAPMGSYVWRLEYEVFIRKGRQKFVETGMVVLLR